MFCHHILSTTLSGPPGLLADASVTAGASSLTVTLLLAFQCFSKHFIFKLRASGLAEDSLEAAPMQAAQKCLPEQGPLRLVAVLHPKARSGPQQEALHGACPQRIPIDSRPRQPITCVSSAARDAMHDATKYPTSGQI